VGRCDDAAFIKYLQEHNPEQAEQGILTKDTVHMNEAGNRFLSQLVLEALAVPASATDS
jgi:lysophospholipase L1-like esterase